MKVDSNFWEIKQAIPATVHAKWVKGHQDELKDGRKIVGPFPRMVDINIEMDKSANKAREDTTINEYTRRTYIHKGMYFFALIVQI